MSQFIAMARAAGIAFTLLATVPLAYAVSSQAYTWKNVKIGGGGGGSGFASVEW